MGQLLFHVLSGSERAGTLGMEFRGSCEFCHWVELEISEHKLILLR